MAPHTPTPNPNPKPPMQSCRYRGGGGSTPPPFFNPTIETTPLFKSLPMAMQWYRGGGLPPPPFFQPYYRNNPPFQKSTYGHAMLLSTMYITWS